MDLTQKRWTVLIVSCLINLCIGTGYAWSVFAAPLAKQISDAQGVTGEAALAMVGAVSLAFTVSNSIGPVTMISGGFFNDKMGPKWVIFVGGLMFGGGVFLTGFATSVTWAIMTYGVIMGLGMGLVYGCTIGNSVKFFPDKRGMVGGLTTACYGLGSVIVPPLANGMISSMGIGTTFKILGIIYLIVICVGAFFVKTCPAGFAPKGWTPPAPVAGAKAPKDKNWKEMIADPIFWIMIIMLTCGAFFGLMVISQASPVAQKMVGMQPAAAAVAVSTLALFNAAGRVCCGFISDKIGRINTLTIVLAAAIVGSGLMYTVSDGMTGKFYVAICIIGFCFGSFMGVFPGFTADQFGPKNNGVNYGIMFIGFAIAGYFGPAIMKSTFAADGAYQKAFLYCVALAALGLLLTFVFRAMSKAKKA